RLRVDAFPEEDVGRRVVAAVWRAFHACHLRLDDAVAVPNRACAPAAEIVDRRLDARAKSRREPLTARRHAAQMLESAALSTRALEEVEDGGWGAGDPRRLHL